MKCFVTVIVQYKKCSWWDCVFPNVSASVWTSVLLNFPGFTAITATNPIWLIKTRLQLETRWGTSNRRVEWVVWIIHLYYNVNDNETALLLDFSMWLQKPGWAANECIRVRAAGVPDGRSARFLQGNVGLIRWHLWDRYPFCHLREHQT